MWGGWSLAAGRMALTVGAVPALDEGMAVVADVRDCAQCGASFAPRREHARFCGAGCRAAWNREHTGGPAAEWNALLWSLTAMGDTSERLRRVRAWDRARALAVIGEAVWWITMVDASLVRHHPRAYNAAMAGQAPAERELVEETLAGLRFVRNQIDGRADLAEFTGPGEPGPAAGDGHITGWVWEPVPAPALGSLSARARAWEMTRYRAYQAQLAGHPLGETFGRTAGFLKQAAAGATCATDVSVHAIDAIAGPDRPAAADCQDHAISVVCAQPVDRDLRGQGW
jgi:hypothetical protein